MHGPSRGGGSHYSGGGSSSSGSSFSSGSSGGYGSFYRGPRTVMFFGRSLYLSNGLSVLLPFLMFFFIFLLIASTACGIHLGNNNREIRYMKEDAIEWQQIIETAKSNNPNDEYYIYNMTGIDFMPDSGVFDDNYTYEGYIYRNHAQGFSVAANLFLTYEGIDYFQLFFVFTDSQTGRKISGITYAQYKNPMNIQEVEFAYKIVSEDEILCINTSYNLEKCMEYHEYQDNVKTATTTTIVTSIMTVAVLAGIIAVVVYGVKSAKKQNALKLQKQQAEAEKAQAEADIKKEELKQKNRYCSYCGSPIPEGEHQCPACGSRIPKD